jgi:hypothetical protein
MQIQVGDRVRYAKAFLQSTGQYCGDVATATGTVTSIAPFAGGLATVDWHNDNVPSKLLAAEFPDSIFAADLWDVEVVDPTLPLHPRQSLQYCLASIPKRNP